MRIIHILLLTTLFLTTLQAQKPRNIAWYTPSCASEINGLAVGLFSGCFRDSYQRTTINGLDIEIFGVGFMLPLAGGDPTSNSFITNGWKQIEADTTPVFHNIINGISLSTGGLGGEDILMNGLHIGGIYITTGKTNGICIGGFFSCMNRQLNGLSIGGILDNQCIEVNGVQIGGFMSASKRVRGIQIGLFNRANSLKGIQIGLWNRSSKRALPFLNVQF